MQNYIGYLKNILVEMKNISVLIKIYIKLASSKTAFDKKFFSKNEI